MDLLPTPQSIQNQIPIVAVNPDKQRYDGVLLPFDISDFIYAVRKCNQ